jgi:hypothetical protein
MTRLLILSVMFFITPFIMLPAYACEDCPDRLNFHETVQQADLIIIGHRTDYSNKEKNFDLEGPEYITVQIIEILKGDVEKNQIQIHSWDGMCDYGIVVDDKDYVMLLKKKGDNYDAVAQGCAEKTLPVIDGLVLYEGKQISIDQFVDKLGDDAFRKILDNSIEKKPLTSLLFLTFMLVVAVVIARTLSAKRKERGEN